MPRADLRGSALGRRAGPARLPAAMALGLLLSPLALALPDDREKPIQIQSDRFELDQAKGTGTYKGNVVLTQGSLRLEAAELVLQRDGERLTKVLAEGVPARFAQKPAADAREIQGQGRRLEYRVGENKVHLIGDARIEQGGDEFNGERIVYDTASSVIQASGGEGGGRIRATIQPREQGKGGQ